MCIWNKNCLWERIRLSYRCYRSKFDIYYLPRGREFPAQRPVTRSFDVFFDLRLNKRLSKQSWCWWFETLSCPLWRHCNVQWNLLTHWWLRQMTDVLQTTCASAFSSRMFHFHQNLIGYFSNGPDDNKSTLLLWGKKHRMEQTGTKRAIWMLQFKCPETLDLREIHSRLKCMLLQTKAGFHFNDFNDSPWPNRRMHSIVHKVCTWMCNVSAPSAK